MSWTIAPKPRNAEGEVAKKGESLGARPAWGGRELCRHLVARGDRVVVTAG